jgi:replicative DNA helicase
MTPDRNIEAEYNIIGAILQDNRIITRVASKLSPDDFTIEHCATIYEAAMDASERGKAFDVVVAADVLKRRVDERTAAAFVLDCVNATPTTVNAELHASIIHKHAGARRLKEAAYETLQLSDNPQELAAGLITTGQNFLQGERHTKRVTMADALTEAWDDISRKDVVGVKMGFPIFDSITNGAEPGELVLIAARPGVGKTGLGMEWAYNAIKQGIQTDFYSLEMPRVQLMKRVLARSTDANMKSLFSRKISEEEWKSLTDITPKLSLLPLTVMDDPYMTVSKVRANSITTRNLGLIVIDYIQLMKADKRFDKRTDEVGDISMALKRLAKELGVPIVALSQLNREVLETEKPTMRCLRECGNLEQDADKIIFLWNIDEAVTPGGFIRAGCDIAKNRNGEHGTFVFKFYGSHMRFIETDEKYQPKKTSRVFKEDTQ